MQFSTGIPAGKLALGLNQQYTMTLSTTAAFTAALSDTPPQQTYAQLIDELATAVFIDFIERGRASLPASANTMLSAGYAFLQRVHPSPWPKDQETIATLKRDIQIALLDGLIREGMPGLRTALMQSYEQMAQKADKRTLALQKEESASVAQAAPPLAITELPIVAASAPSTTLPESTKTSVHPDAPTSREEVLQGVRMTVAEHLHKDIDSITLDTSFVADLGADSLDLVELVMMLEDRLMIELKDEDAQQLGTVRNAVDLACQRLNLTTADAPQEMPSANSDTQ